jgi:hypothetical protein
LEFTREPFVMAKTFLSTSETTLSAKDSHGSMVNSAIKEKQRVLKKYNNKYVFIFMEFPLK